MTPEPLEEIAGWLASFSGISTKIIGSQTLRRAVQQRLACTGLPDVATYQERLLASAEEQQCLVELVVVPETWFFRDRHPYHYLRQFVTSWLKQRLPAQPLRLLSAPCATGEEPYSMAMTLLDLGLSSQDFHIDAIDISRQSIRKARQAVYGQHSFRGVSETEKKRSFHITPQGFALHSEVRDTVRFQRSNLMTCLAGKSSRYDVIFCRNLLIYLHDSASEQLLASLAGLLKVGGLLIVGSAETAKVPTRLFTPIRQSFVFGFLRMDPQVSPPRLSPSSEGSSTDAQPAVSLRSPRRSQPRIMATTMKPAGAGGVALRPSLSAPLLQQDQQPLPGDALELQRWRRAIEQDPASDAAYLRLGHWLMIHNRADEAMECLRKCLYLRPDCREAMQMLIQLTQQLGQTERSLHYQQRLARLDS